MRKKLSIIKNGIIDENPIFRLVLGTCPTLGVSTQAINGLGMGLAVTFVLIGSNAVISLLRNFIPQKVRIPAFIVVIAGFVTIVELLTNAFLPELYEALGVYIPLIVVNCIILARAETFASKNTVGDSILDGLGMGLGFTASLTLLSIVRELIGAGTIFGFAPFGSFYTPVTIFILAPGGFIAFGIMIAIFNKLTARRRSKEAEA